MNTRQLFGLYSNYICQGCSLADNWSLCVCDCVYTRTLVWMRLMFGYEGTSSHTCVAVLCSMSLVTSEPQRGGQRRRLTEAIPQPAVSIISPWGQRLFHPGEHEWREVNNSATPEQWHLSTLRVVSILVHLETAPELLSRGLFSCEGPQCCWSLG